MALPSLTARTLGATQLQLTYSDGRQYFLNYRDINATELDGTSGITKVRIYLSGGLDESISVTATDLSTTTPSTTPAAFIAALNALL